MVRALELHGQNTTYALMIDAEWVVSNAESLHKFCEQELLSTDVDAFDITVSSIFGRCPTFLTIINLTTYRLGTPMGEFYGPSLGYYEQQHTQNLQVGPCTFLFNIYANRIVFRGGSRSCDYIRYTPRAGRCKVDGARERLWRQKNQSSLV